MQEVPIVPNTQSPVGLPERVAAALADDGVLALAMPAFEPRQSQRHMADGTARILNDGGILLAEAGTGTGKTIAYLVPAILSGQRVLISTETKNLQDQIYYKDLPALREALGVNVSATYMKGRANYLCLHRFDAIRSDTTSRSVVDKNHLDQIAEWAAQTETGDRAEVEDLPDNFSLWNDIAATSENCIGTECPKYQDCYVTKMRQRAAESDLVIVNHHLLCADTAMRKSAYGEVIPACTFAVIDEAHQLEDVATQHFGLSVSSHRLDELNSDGRRLIISPSVTVTLEESIVLELTDLISQIQDGARFFFDSLTIAVPTSERTRMTTETFAPISEPGRHLILLLGNLANVLMRNNMLSEDLIAMGRRAAEIRDQLSFILDANDPSFVYFVERRRRSVFLHAAPIDVSSIIRELLLDRMSGTVLTSATLTVDGSFNYIRGRLGIKDATEIRFPSEFDYSEQTILYMPTTMPAPENTGFTDAVAREVSALLQVTAGRAFVLFTSYANLRNVQARLASTIPYPLLVQGTAPRSVLLREFRCTPSAVLLATSSFWHGVDVAGETLSCVIIDKLPFASPGDPLTAARIKKIEDDGGNPFVDYQVPLAILTLLQGFGRLLRHRTDRGVLALLDPRLRSKSYGRRFLESFPPAPMTSDLTQVDTFFNGAD